MQILRLLACAACSLTIATACSKSSPSPLPDDLKQDLAKAGGTDVQLAGSATPRLDVVSAAERTRAYAPAPKSKTVARAATTGRKPDVASPSPRAESPAPAPAKIERPEPVEAPVMQPAPSPVPAAGRPEAPKPSTQREPRGGWRTPGDIIRRAPFPINP